MLTRSALSRWLVDEDITPAQAVSQVEAAHQTARRASRTLYQQVLPLLREMQQAYEQEQTP